MPIPRRAVRAASRRPPAPPILSEPPLRRDERNGREVKLHHPLPPISRQAGAALAATALSLSTRASPQSPPTALFRHVSQRLVDLETAGSHTMGGGVGGARSLLAVPAVSFARASSASAPSPGLIFFGTGGPSRFTGINRASAAEEDESGDADIDGDDSGGSAGLDIDDGRDYSRGAAVGSGGGGGGGDETDEEIADALRPIRAIAASKPLRVEDLLPSPGVGAQLATKTASSRRAASPPHFELPDEEEEGEEARLVAAPTRAVSATTGGSLKPPLALRPFPTLPLPPTPTAPGKTSPLPPSTATSIKATTPQQPVGHAVAPQQPVGQAVALPSAASRPSAVPAPPTPTAKSTAPPLPATPRQQPTLDSRLAAARTDAERSEILRSALTASASFSRRAVLSPGET